jgi:signal transduction histidine kinase
MKIRTKLTLRYLFVTLLLLVAVFSVLEELLFPQAGYDMLHILNLRLLAVWVISFVLLFVIGCFMASSVLKPVSEIVEQVKDITASNLSKRVAVKDSKDEIGELAHTFNNTLDRLEKSFESQRMFISNVSHELRTPMAALIAELELSLYKERSSEDYKKVLENALADARNIEKLSNGLMDLAKTSYNASQISMTAVRLDEVLLERVWL